MRNNGRSEKIDTLQSVELGEGVEIRLRIAGPFPRALAMLLDFLIIFGVVLIIAIILSLMAISSATYLYAGGVILIVAFVSVWGYFYVFESGKRGATIGKRTVGLRVVDRSGNNASKGQIFVRNVLRYVDMLPFISYIPILELEMFIMMGTFALGLICCLLSKKFQRVGDMVANTLVVYTHPEVPIVGQQPTLNEKIAPPLVLTREEQTALVSYYQRAGMWSEARRIELADHAEGLTRERGNGGMIRLLSMAYWLTENK